MIILIGPFLSCASIPTFIVESKGYSFYTILILCVSCIVVIFPQGARHHECNPCLTDSVDDVASCSSVVSNSTTKICELLCVWQGIFLYFLQGQDLERLESILLSSSC